MRSRWEFSNPGPYIAAWFVFGMAAFMTIGALTNPCDRHGCGMNSNTLSTASNVTLAVWIGPLALALAVAIVGGLLWAMWAFRPRRVTEPVLTDLREANDG